MPIIEATIFTLSLPILLLLLGGLVLAIFAVYKSRQCGQGIVMNVIAFLLAPFWLVWYYLMGGKNQCGMSKISAGQLEAYSKMINQKF
jgi:hypothetical protein